MQEIVRAGDLRRFVDQFTREVQYFDRDAKISYQRLVGGVAWPHDARAGAVVVVGEHRSPLPGMEAHRVDVLAEYAAQGVDELMNKMAEWQDRFGCMDWRTPLNAPEMQMAQDFNEERRRWRKPVLEIASPAAVRGERTFRAYHRLVERRTRHVKTLFFGEGSMIARDYKARHKDDVNKRLEIFPVVAAFMYAFADIELNRGSAASRPVSGVADSIGGY